MTGHVRREFWGWRHLVMVGDDRTRRVTSGARFLERLDVGNTLVDRRRGDEPLLQIVDRGKSLGIEGAGFAVAHELAPRHQDAGSSNAYFELGERDRMELVALWRVMTGHVGHARIVAERSYVAVGYPHRFW